MLDVKLQDKENYNMLKFLQQLFTQKQTEKNGVIFIEC